jgi:hypothetical protein
MGLMVALPAVEEGRGGEEEGAGADLEEGTAEEGYTSQVRRNPYCAGRPHTSTPPRSAPL